MRTLSCLLVAVGLIASVVGCEARVVARPVVVHPATVVVSRPVVREVVVAPVRPVVVVKAPVVVRRPVIQERVIIR
jgi:hypothetical protein